MSVRNKVLSFLGLIFVVALGYYLFSTPSSQDLVLIGTVDSNQVIVSPQIPGRIAKLLVEEGTPVKQGDLIALIDPAELEAEARAAAAMIDSLRSQVNSSQATREATQGSTTSSVANAQARLQSTRAQLAQAEATLVRVQSDSKRTIELAASGVASDQERVQAESNLSAQQATVQALKDQGYVDKPEEFTADVDALVSRLKPDGSMAKRAARMVAYLWQAALVAQDAGLIPEEFEAERFAKEIWAEACAGDLKPESRVLGAIERLAENLVAKRGVEIPDLTKKEDGTGIAGFTTDRVYREPVAWIAAHTAKPALKGGDKPEPQRVYVVPASKLLELAGCKVDGNSVTDRQLRKALVDEGYLCLPPMPPKGRQEFAFDGWPGLARTRYIVIFANMVEAEAEPPQAANEDGERSPDSARTRSHT